MNYYRIFVYERGYSKSVNIEAVKIGFSYPAFLFAVTWLAYKGMWGTAAALLFLAVLTGGTVGSITAYMKIDPSMGGASAVFVLEWLWAVAVGLILILPAAKGNAWYAKKLLKRGFRQAVIIVAPNPDRAKIIFDKEYVYDNQADVWFKLDGILA